MKFKHENEELKELIAKKKFMFNMQCVENR